MEAGWDQCPFGVAVEGRSSIPRGTLWESEDQGERQLVIPCPISSWEACWGPRPGPPPSEVPYGCMGARGIGGREEGGRGGADVGSPPGPEDQGKHGWHFPHPLWL